MRLEKPGPVQGRLSAGVALRPLLQDAVLPTCAYVGGPSEVGYQAELLPAYRAFGIEPPVVFPRVTATLLEPKIAKVRERAELSGERLFESEAMLGPLFMRQEEDVAGALEKLPDRYMTEVAELMRRLPDAPSRYPRASPPRAGRCWPGPAPDSDSRSWPGALRRGRNRAPGATTGP